MHCTQNGTVIDLLTDERNILHKFVLVNISENTLAEHRSSPLHLASYGSIIVGKVGVISAGINNAKSVTAGSKVEIDLFDYRLRRILEIYRYKAADRACRLIEKSARLAEKFILGILSNLCKLHGSNLAVVIKVVENRAHKYLICRRGRKSRAGKHTIHACAIKAADIVTILLETGAHSPYKRACLSEFLRAHLKVVYIYLNGVVSA